MSTSARAMTAALGLAILGTVRGVGSPGIVQGFASASAQQPAGQQAVWITPTLASGSGFQFEEG